MKYLWGVISVILVVVFFVSGYAIVAFDDDPEPKSGLNHTLNASSTLVVTDDLKTDASPDSISSNGTKHYVINVSDSPIVGEN